MSNIKKGDKVVIIRTRFCGCPGDIGRIATVEEIRGPNHAFVCGDCGKTHYAYAAHLEGDVPRVWCELVRLKKLDDPTDDAGETREAYLGIPATRERKLEVVK